jgi:phospholipase/carboxylesterase
MNQSRRQFLATLAGSAAVMGCIHPEEGIFTNTMGGGSSRLTARPQTPSLTTAPGSYLITESRPLDGSLIVPSSYTPGTPMPLIVGLHGAGGLASGQVSLLGGLAEQYGFLLLAVGARGITWDVFSSKYSYDITFIDGALKWVFQRCNVDASRVAIEGFSDGASYALGLAVTNGDLFPKAICFSPGYLPAADSPLVGKAKFFDSHGTADTVLRIDAASRPIVDGLRKNGYEVTYQEFTGGHEVPPAIAAQAVAWLVG